MPMMRDMPLFLAQNLGQILDDRPEIGARRQRFGAGGQNARALGDGSPIPGFRQRSAQPRLLLAVASPQAAQLLAERGAAGLVEPSRLGLLERLLDLEHLGEEL